MARDELTETETEEFAAIEAYIQASEMLAVAVERLDETLGRTMPWMLCLLEHVEGRPIRSVEDAHPLLRAIGLALDDVIRVLVAFREAGQAMDKMERERSQEGEGA